MWARTGTSWANGKDNEPASRSFDAGTYSMYCRKQGTEQLIICVFYRMRAPPPPSGGVRVGRNVRFASAGSAARFLRHSSVHDHG